eukprot:jgi/Botrbrau1/17955/Bobra.50_1s0047.1
MEAGKQPNPTNLKSIVSLAEGGVRLATPPSGAGRAIFLLIGGALHPHIPKTLPPGDPPKDPTLLTTPKKSSAGAHAAPSPSELSGVEPRETPIEAVGEASVGNVGAEPITPMLAPARETKDLEESACSDKGPDAGFPLWSQLPTDVQRLILQSQGLSLRDLARSALVSKLYREAFSLRFDADDQWLSGVAPSLFGQDVVEFFLEWLPRTGQHNHTDDNSAPVVDLTKGDALPTGDALLSLECLVLKLPARGLGGGCQETLVTCKMFLLSHFSIISVQRDSSRSPLLTLRVSNLFAPEASMCPRNNAEMVACLGLWHQVCKQGMYWERPLTRVLGAPPPALVLCFNKALSAPRDWAEAACLLGPEDVARKDGQRALSALQAWKARFPRDANNLRIYLDPGAG